MTRHKGEHGSLIIVTEGATWKGSAQPFLEGDKVLVKTTIESRSGPLPYMIKIKDGMVTSDDHIFK